MTTAPAVVQLFRQRRLRKTLAALFFISLAIAIFMVPIEARHPAATIRNLWDAVWWVVTTITTVGYGNIVPVTIEGQILGIILQLIGVLFFGSIIGSFTILLNQRRDDYLWQKLFARLEKSEADLEELKKKSDFIILQNGSESEKNE